MTKAEANNHEDVSKSLQRPGKHESLASHQVKGRHSTNIASI